MIDNDRKTNCVLWLFHLALWMELEHFERIISRIHNYIQIVRFLNLQKIKWQVIAKVNVTHCSLKYHLSTWSLSTLVHFSNFHMSLKILLQQKSGFCFCGHSEMTISTSWVLWNWQLPKFCFSGTNCIWACFVQRVKWWACDLLPVKSLISAVTEFLNSCQDQTNLSVYLEIVLKNNDTSVE